MRQGNKIAGLFTVLFFVLFMGQAKSQDSQVIDRVVAVVGQNIILQSDIEAAGSQSKTQIKESSF